MKQACKEIVVVPLRAGLDLQGEQVEEQGHDQHVAQNGRFRNSMNVAPPRLETELAAEINEIPQVGIKRQLLDPPRS